MSPPMICRSRCAGWRSTPNCFWSDFGDSLDEEAAKYMHLIDDAKRMQVVVKDLLV